MKLRELQNYLVNKDIDLTLFFNLQNQDPNLFYFSQLSNIGFACLAIPKEKKPILFVSKLDYERAKSESKLNIHCIKNKLSDSLIDFFKKNKIRSKTIAVNKSNLTVSSFKAIKNKFKKSKFKDIANFCSQLRAQKTEKEIEHITKACKITDQTLTETLQNFKKFKTETQVEAQLDFLAKQQFADTAFKTIVASGKNASFPHHETKNRPLQKGFCVIDFGVKYKGYCSDITRTIYIGKPKKSEKDIYNLVLNSQLKAIEKIKENASCSEIDKQARNVLNKHKKLFIHGLGHGIGIQPHEYPTLSPKSKDKLKQNMVFTVEPGIYFPYKFGIRIEDDVLLGKNVKILTRTNKNLIIV
ncbi:Xaa-Pro peptidase family protein [Candidatus Woesearchaeota archaeon]|nr:Xaa-Pro peptidase family protein [Candidatus Woesearchaeota archaeon]